MTTDERKCQYCGNKWKPRKEHPKECPRCRCRLDYISKKASSERERILKIIKHRRKFMTITIQDEYDELRAEIEKEGMK